MQVVTGVQAETLVQERALAQELRKLAEEATALAQEAKTLANIFKNPNPTLFFIESGQTRNPWVGRKLSSLVD